MGYTTSFYGTIKVEPPLTAAEADYLRKFSETRRMERSNGPYFVGGEGYLGQDRGPDTIYHDLPSTQPGYWCHWAPTADGSGIEWDGGEKFYDAAAWMKYLIEHFLKPNPIAEHAHRDRSPEEAPNYPPMLIGHICNGVIEAQGEESDDRWNLVVENNVVKVATSEVVFHPAEPI